MVFGTVMNGNPYANAALQGMAVQGGGIQPARMLDYENLGGQVR